MANSRPMIPGVAGRLGAPLLRPRGLVYQFKDDMGQDILISDNHDATPWRVPRYPGNGVVVRTGSKSFRGSSPGITRGLSQRSVGPRGTLSANVEPMGGNRCRRLECG